MRGSVTYELKDSIATIAMDDGKVNALTLEMFKELNSAPDQAQTDGSVRGVPAQRLGDGE